MKLILITFIILYFYLIFKLRKKIESFFFVDEFYFHLKNNFDLFFSVMIIFFFFFIFFFYLRFLRVFLETREYVDAMFFYEKIKIVLTTINLTNFFFYSFIILILMFFFFFFLMITLILIVSLNIIIIFFAKKSFLKLHYYIFFRFDFYVKFILFFSTIDLILIKKLKKMYLVLTFKFLIQYGFSIFMLFFFIKNIIFDSCNIYLGFIPYYSLYIFFFRIYKFLCSSLCYDFDLVLAQFYYPKLNYVFRSKKSDIIEYNKFLMFNYSKYLFVDSIYLDFPWLIKSNWLMADVFKYTLNKFPNDFHTRIKNEKPKIYNNYKK